MIVLNILAALALQTSPMTPAQCRLNDGPVTACEVMVQRRGEYVGVGFNLPGGTLIFGSRHVDAQTSAVELVSVGESTVRTTGVCLFKPAERMLGCKANVNGQDVTIVAQVP